MTESVLRFSALEKHFPDTQVLRGVNAEIHRGEVIGLLGLNGAGKTTLLETALGFSLPSSGTCELFGGINPGRLTEKDKARIGFVPQQDELLEGISGARYLELISSFYTQWNHELVERLSREWQVPLKKKIRTLSQGQRQKLSILAALGHEPELLVLDEPVASLDPVARRLFLKELVDIASDGNRTIIFSTHIVSDLERVASRVWLIKDGLIVLDEAMDNLKETYEQSLEDVFLEMHP